jgi:hypothetical protein
MLSSGSAVTVPYIGLLVTDPRIGVAMNSTADQGAKLQAATPSVFSLGNALQSGNPGDIDVAAVFVKSGVSAGISEVDRENMESYLGDKYGLTFA